MLQGSFELRMVAKAHEPRLQSNFTAVKANSSAVWIVDDFNRVPSRLSVTNDAEAVCHHVAKHYGEDIVIYYRDTDDNWDQLVHDKGRFITFAPARDRGLG